MCLCARVRAPVHACVCVNANRARLSIGGSAGALQSQQRLNGTTHVQQYSTHTHAIELSHAHARTRPRAHDCSGARW
eukprot:529422-Pleurochrysis_carterae.AAC.1